MKNTPKIILTAFMLIGIIVSPVNAAFPDVSSDHFYSDAINYVKAEGIVDGFSDGTFGPEKTITRAEFTKIIVNSLYSDIVNDDRKVVETCEEVEDLNPAGFQDYTIFPDIQFLSSFGRYICIAKNLSILNGYPDGTFKPENPITVGEASKIISNAFGFTNVQSGAEGDIFKPFIDALSEQGSLPGTLLDIDDHLLRGEMAEIIYRLEVETGESETKTYLDLKYPTIESERYENSELGLAFNLPSSFKLLDTENGLRIQGITQVPSVDMFSLFSIDIENKSYDQYIEFLDIAGYTEYETGNINIAGNNYSNRGFSSGEGGPGNDGEMWFTGWRNNVIKLRDDLYIVIRTQNESLEKNGEVISEFGPTDYDLSGGDMVIKTLELL